LQAPGTDGGQAPLETVEAMAQCYVDALRAQRPRGPYVLGGWSSGGTLAFDMARRLEADGERVAHVVMIDAPAPLQSAEVDDATLLRWFIEDLDLGVDAAAVALAEARATGDAGPAGPAGDLQHVLSTLPALSALSGVAGIDAQRLAPVLQVFSAVVRAGRRYRLQAPIDAPITVIKARDQRVTEFADHPGVAAPDWGWGPWSHGGVQAFELPGAHHTLLAEPHVEALASTLATVAGLAMEAQP
jgi:thioesterase domain-containing protein